MSFVKDHVHYNRSVHWQVGLEVERLTINQRVVGSILGTDKRMYSSWELEGGWVSYLWCPLPSFTAKVLLSKALNPNLPQLLQGCCTVADPAEL